jgi:hypothetical protein
VSISEVSGFPLTFLLFYPATGDVLFILLCFAAVLVVLSGTTYMMMFRKKKG